MKSILLAGFVFAFVLGAGFVAFVTTLDRSEREPKGRADGIVALTGGAQRIGDAIDLLAKGYARRLLITGVNERTSRQEIARLNPGQRRLFDCCVDLDYRARNTIGNAVETRRWMEDHRFSSLIVVTSNYHMPRTLLELDATLPAAEKVPFPVVHEGTQAEDWWRNPATARLLASEYVKYLAGWLRTRVEPARGPARDHGPAPVRVAAEPGR
ncbi:MAG TPA: YdcF family protein [Beijerinckiaceae bacterium]